MMKKYVLHGITLETVSKLAAFFHLEQQSLPQTILLRGEVGTGKTAFAYRYVMNVDTSVSFASPTYSIVRTYNIDKMTIHHFDLYRIGEHDYEWIYEYLGSESARFLFEWPDLHRSLFDDIEYVELEFIYQTEKTRNVVVSIDNKYQKKIKEFGKHEGIVFTECDEPVSS